MQNQIYANSDQIVPCWSKLGFVSNDIDTLNCDKSNFIVNKMDKFYFYLDCNDKEWILYQIKRVNVHIDIELTCAYFKHVSIQLQSTLQMVQYKLHQYCF